MSTRSISWGKGGRCVRLTTYQHPVPLSRNLGASTSWNHLDLSRPVMGLFLYPYFLLFFCLFFSFSLRCSIVSYVSFLLLLQPLTALTFKALNFAPKNLNLSPISLFLQMQTNFKSTLATPILCKSTLATPILCKLTPDKLLSWQNVLMHLTRFGDVTTLLLDIRVFWDTTLMTNATRIEN